MFEDRIRGDRRAVQEFADAARHAADLGEQLREPFGDRAGIIVDRRRHLLGVTLAPIAEQHDVGEGPPDIDPGPEAARHLTPDPRLERRYASFETPPMAAPQDDDFS